MFSESDPPKPEPSRSDPPKPSTAATSPSPAAPQELTLSYLCEKDNNTPNPDLLFARNATNKGKEIAASADSPPREHDFLQLGPAGGNKRREAGGVQLAEPEEKKPKLDSLNLSLSLNSADLAAQGNGTGHGAQSKRAYSINTRTNTMNSDDFNPSMSYSYSVPFSHNPSCSLTRNSTDFDFSRDNEQIWHAGEGTNGSVHSKFKPIGESIVFANPGAGNPTFLRGHVSSGPNVNMNGTENSISFFPSELPARPHPIVGPVPGPSRVNGMTASSDSGRGLMLARPERVLKEIVSESVPTVAGKLQDLPIESLEALREACRALVTVHERKDELASFQRRLDRRSDLILETLTKCHKTQLEILVAIKTGLPGFVSGKCRVPPNELAEMFLLMRCRNLTCKGLLPVDDCECKICISKKGFCSACMCPVCLKFDCANNTCSWVGCDVCSHWCHASCALDKNLIRPGPSLKGPAGTTEMQFHCIGCGHASEMFGFVKEVFNCCAKMWSPEVLLKELDCVRKIFASSEDFEGKGLHAKAGEVIGLLSKKVVSPEVACNSMLEFFKYGVTEFSVTGSKSKSTPILAQAAAEMAVPALPSTPVIPPKAGFNFKPSASIPDMNPNPSPKPSPLALDNRFAAAVVSNSAKEDEVKSLETIVKCKEAEAKLFQRLADDAKREVESYRQLVRARSEKLEEEYGAAIARLCLKEAEERRRKNIEELKLLENSQLDYQKMKMRMQTEIASLLERMEATKKMWV
ncbi:OBERON-like protein [Rhynchospora pubera]|uniref:OBERON-like protein n=1 Tax=Rhynchospora pubera TaxID=906938 RepID=A0AAV8C5S7_9POAL|nr:OBERON-like protein [Rhynchospora pubera]